MNEKKEQNDRRHFLKKLPVIASLPYLAFQKKQEAMPVSCNSYNWLTFYRRSGGVWGKNLDEDFMEFSKTGIKAYEPGLSGLEEARQLIPVLKKYGIAMPSVYVNSTLHQKDKAAESISAVLKIADELKSFGTKIIVTNPSPIKWGSNDLKTDAELETQAKSMEELGRQLKQRGMTLAYHTHEIELKAGAREFHHILLNTSPEFVSFCFDVHWIYRGSSNSQVAVFDVLKLYGKRVVELHLRQSKGEIWSETFGEGDIDYARLAIELKKLNLRPHLVIEQCIEDKSPNTMNVVEAHIRDLEQVKKVFKPILQP